MVNPQISPADNKDAIESKPKFQFSLAPLSSFIEKIFAFTQNIIGIDIGSSYIKVAQIQKTPKGYAITSYITRVIPQAIKEDAEQKRKFIREIVKQFIADSKKKTNLCRLAIAGKGVFVLSVVVPYLKKKDLKGAVAIELKKRLPFQSAIENVFFDFFITGQTSEEAGISLQVTCIAADNVRLDEEVRFLKEMNIRPVAINVIPDCLGNLLPYCIEAPKDKTIVLLDLGANTSLLNFYKERTLVFSREIPLGGEHFTGAMAKGITIVNPSDGRNISTDDAEKLKRNCGIPLEDEAKTEYLTDFGLLRGEQISTILRPVLERIVIEVTRTFSYYIKTFKAPNIEELYLTGGTSRLRNIDKFLLYNLPGLKKVEKLNTLKGVKGWLDTGILKQELVVEQAAPHLAVAFGLCFGSGGKVNLLPLKEKIEQKAIFLTVLLRFSFPLLLFLILGLYAITYGNALNYKVLINRINGEINRLEPAAKDVREYLGIKTRLDQRKQLLEKAKGKQPYWWGLFKELSNITPKDVILEKITVVEQKDPKKIRLSGKIFARYTIVDLALSQYLMSLDESPYFSLAELVSSKTDMYSPVPAANFEIDCQLNY